jgi:hypothetical protein
MNASQKKGGVLKKRSKPPQITVTPPPVSEVQHQVWESYRDRMKLASPALIQKGQIWSTLTKPRRLKGIKPNSDADSRLVLVLDQQFETLAYEEHEYQKIVIAPISIKIELATCWDFIIEQDSSPLGYSFMVELWNKATILTDSVDRYLGELDRGTFELVEHLDLDQIRSSLEEFKVDLPFYGQKIGEREIKPGNEVYNFQRNEVQEISYLTEPVRYLTDVSSSRETNQTQASIIQKLKSQMQHPSLNVINEIHFTEIGDVA